MCRSTPSTIGGRLFAYALLAGPSAILAHQAALGSLAAGGSGSGAFEPPSVFVWVSALLTLSPVRRARRFLETHSLSIKRDPSSISKSASSEAASRGAPDGSGAIWTQIAIYTWWRCAPEPPLKLPLESENETEGLTSLSSNMIDSLGRLAHLSQIKAYPLDQITAQSINQALRSSIGAFHGTGPLELAQRISPSLSRCGQRRGSLESAGEKWRPRALKIALIGL